MTESVKHTNSAHKIAGIIEILISAFLSFHDATIFYSYRANPNVLRPFITPDWVLIYNFLIGLLGIWSGIQIWRSNWTIKKGYLLFIGLWIIGQIVYFITTAL